MGSGKLNDYPDLKEVFDDLMREKEKIRSQTQHLHDEYKEHQNQYTPLLLRARELAKEWQAIERPRLGQIDMQLSAIAASIGGKRTSD